MGLEHPLPEPPKGLKDSAAKRVRKPRIPTTGHHGSATIPEEVVAGIKWCQLQGMVWSQARVFYPGLPAEYFNRVRAETTRAHVLPKCPPFVSEHFWKERYRWPVPNP